MKSFLRGQSYVSVMVDLEQAAPRVLEVCAGRKKEDASELIGTLPEARREPFRQAQGPELVEGQIETVAMDLSPAYQGAVAETLPPAAVVLDKFHVSKVLGAAVDKVRRGEPQRWVAQGDERLCGTRYAWLYHPGELMARRPDPARDEAFEAPAFSNLQTARASYHRILFLEFWPPPDISSAQRFLTQWYHRARRRRLAPMRKAAETLKNHHGLLSYLQHRLTNATTEARNASIPAIKSAARGFRSFENYRIRLLFFLERLNLHPR